MKIMKSIAHMVFCKEMNPQEAKNWSYSINHGQHYYRRITYSDKFCEKVPLAIQDKYFFGDRETKMPEFEARRYIFNRYLLFLNPQSMESRAEALFASIPDSSEVGPSVDPEKEKREKEKEQKEKEQKEKEQKEKEKEKENEAPEGLNYTAADLAVNCDGVFAANGMGTDGTVTTVYANIQPSGDVQLHIEKSNHSTTSTKETGSLSFASFNSGLPNKRKIEVLCICFLVFCLIWLHYWIYLLYFVCCLFLLFSRNVMMHQVV